MFKTMTLATIATALCLASATFAIAEPNKTGKFEWTTDSSEAVKLIAEVQARVENFQLGAGTLETARKLVAADPDFAMGTYYLSAVVPSPEREQALEKAVAQSKHASDGERRFIEAMVKARANGGASFAEAIPLLEALAKDYPNERLVPMIQGQIYQGTGDAARARAAFTRALEIGPPSNRARSFLANDDLLHEKYSEARTNFMEIEKALPPDAAAAAIRYGIAFSYLYEGKDGQAIESLEAFLKQYRDSGQNTGFPEVFILNSIARIHLENGRAEKALSAYDKGYKSVPESSLPDDQKTIWYGRLKHGKSRALAKLGRHDEAWKVAEELHEMIETGGEAGTPFVPAYHYLAGYLKLEAGDASEAAEHLAQANPNDPFHQLLLARALDKLGQGAKAKEVYESITKSTNNGLERALAYPEAKRMLEG